MRSLEEALPNVLPKTLSEAIYMKTKLEVQTKLQMLRDARNSFTHEDQLKLQDAEIKRLEWVLGAGPDPIRVPRP
jgi:hypothetical protein